MIVIYTALITLCNSFNLLVATYPSHTERRINSTYNMDDVTHHHGDRRSLHWMKMHQKCASTSCIVEIWQDNSTVRKIVLER